MPDNKNDDIILFLNHLGQHQYVDIGSGRPLPDNHPFYKKRFAPINATYFSDTMTEGQARKALSDYLGPAAKNVHLVRYGWPSGGLKKAAAERKKRDYKHPTLKQRLMAPFTNPVSKEILKGTGVGFGLGLAGHLALRKNYGDFSRILPIAGAAAGMGTGAQIVRHRVNGWQEKAKRTRERNRLKKMGLQASS